MFSNRGEMKGNGSSCLYQIFTCIPLFDKQAFHFAKEFSSQKIEDTFCCPKFGSCCYFILHFMSFLMLAISFQGRWWQSHQVAFNKRFVFTYFCWKIWAFVSLDLSLTDESFFYSEITLCVITKYFPWAE